MSPRLSRDPFAGDHGRARELAVLRLDEPLSAGNATWLTDHLAGCAPCRTVAAAYDDQRALLRSLRDTAPLAPRDLWARTSAAIDAAGPRGSRRGRRLRRAGRFPLAPVAAVMVVAVAVGAGLLNGASLVPGHTGDNNGGSPLATPIAMTAGEVQVLTRGADGVLELSTRRYDSVCPVGAATCGTSAATDTTRLSANLADPGSFDAFISPTRDHIVVMQKSSSEGASATGVYVVPVQDAVNPAASPVPSPPVLSPSPAIASPTPPEASSSASASPTSPEPSTGPGASASAPATPSPTPSPTPTPTPSPTPSPSPTVSTGPSTSPGSSPDASVTPDQSAAASPGEPSPGVPSPSASVGVTPVPGGAIEIVRDVIIVGTVSGYSSDGTSFAFTARPSDGSAGPDVYVWHTPDSQAHRVTTDHASLFAAWLGDQLLISRATDGTTTTALLDPATGAEQPVQATGMWRPTVGPGARFGVWWDGTVQLAGDGFTWIPADGQLVLGTWPDGTGAQAMAAGIVRDWQVRWDETGTALAVWVSDGTPGQPGRLSLYAVDAATGVVNLGAPLLADAPAFEGFSLQAGRLAWSAPGGGDTTVQVLAWSGDTVGQLQLPTANGVTVVR